jgi:DNA-binding TFAR19-related protein (PDSD5 family)
MSLNLDEIKSSLALQQGGTGGADAEKKEQQRLAAEERKNNLLHKILTPAALERCLINIFY